MAEERILLAQLADIGDLVLTTPAIAALREARPNARIDLLAAEHALPVLPPGLIDRAIPFQRAENSASRAFFALGNLRALRSISRAGYDCIVIFHHFTLRAGVFKFWLLWRLSGARRVIGLQNRQIGFLTDSVRDEGFGARHQAQYWLDLVALLGASDAPRSAQAQHASPPENLPPASTGPRIVIHAGSGGYSRARRWSTANFAQVARRLQDELGAAIILVGRADDHDEALAALPGNIVSLVGKTSLPQLAGVIGAADLFIGADSGVMHIAAASGTPVIGIFGPSNSQAWGPWTVDGRALVLRSGVACSPCSYVGHGIGARDGCAARTCMKLVGSERVVEAARSMLDKPGPTRIQEAVTRQPMAASAGRLTVLGTPVDGITYAGWLERVSHWITRKDGARQVCTVNPEFIMIAQRDSIFRSLLGRAALCLPDGVGLLWASRRLGAPLPQRVTGSDGLPRLAERAAAEGWKLFLLGAGPGVAERAAARLCARFPGLIIAGAHGGSPAEDAEDEIVDRVNASGADILFVAYGAPAQDKWIARNLPRLEVAMAMGVGGSLDFVAGVVPRAPQWMRDRGLEWLFRLMRQPWRLRRMTRLPRFAFAVWRQARASKDATPYLR